MVRDMFNGIKSGNTFSFPSHRNEKTSQLKGSSFVFVEEGRFTEKGLISNLSYDGDKDTLEILPYRKDGFLTPDGQALIVIIYSPFKKPEESDLNRDITW